jgi:hypothetical protein
MPGVVEGQEEGGRERDKEKKKTTCGPHSFFSQSGERQLPVEHAEERRLPQGVAAEVAAGSRAPRANMMLDT